MTLKPWLYLMILLLSAGAFGAETPATGNPEETASASASDVENVIDTLKDPASREALIEDLQVLLEAKQKTSTEKEVVDTIGVWQWTTEYVTSAWESFANVDPREVMISTLITVGIILAAVAIRWLIIRTLRRLYRRLAGHEAGADIPFPAMVTRLIDLIVLAVGAAVILQAWGANVGSLLETEIGARSAEMLLSIGIILIVTAFLWHASHLVVEKALRGRSRQLEHERRSRRLDTLVPLLRSVIRIAISIVAALVILSELGINTGPLLAGAGILGLAIGFGAQSLVKDFITGVTILLEDSASVDDVIEIGGGHIGKVEDMRIRIIQLRDIAGIVHVLPYSEVTSIKNYTKDFSYYLFDVGVAYREDLDEVIEILTELSDEFCEDEDYKHMILEPLEVLGVDRFDDSAVVIRTRIKTTPKERWTVGREFNRRIKKRFDKKGIEIPFPHTTLYMGEPKEGQAAPMALTFAEKEERMLEKLSGPIS